ncbi:MAG: hypothetical protein O3B25_15860, partial [Verrucomicrobia bacterium]|nr:hypothetical protein [Verrucomicrobiota bacterium]
MKSFFFPFCSLLLLVNVSWSKPEALEISLDKVKLLPGGKEADGIVGDFLIRNDRIEAVIAHATPLRKANMGTFWGAENVTPGCLYDLTLRGAANDQITVFSPSRQQGKVSYVRISKDGSDGEAIVEVVVTSTVSGALFKRHEYILKDGWQGVLIRSTIRNEGDKLVDGPVTDKWTNFRSRGKIGSIEWADSIDPADKAGYAYAWLPGKDGAIPPGTARLKPGDEIRIERFLAVGRSPAEAVGLVANQLELKTGELSVQLKENDGGPVSTGRLEISTGGQVIPAYPDDDGRIRLLLPQGKASVIFVDHGRMSMERDFTVGAKNVELTLELEPRSGITFEVRKQNGSFSPCKAQFIGIDGTPSPNLGPTDRAHGCRDQYHSESGKFYVALAPGKYRVVLTRGIE